MNGSTTTAGRRFGADERGAAAVEFAFVGPVLIFLLFAIVQFGLTLNNYLQLTNGVRVAGRQFAISRASSTPYTSTKTAMINSAPNLGAANITLTLQVNGTACATDAACVTALATANGLPATVIATYPCNLNIVGVNFAPGCKLTSQTTDLIE